MLLILDNFDHLVAEARPPVDILQLAPCIKRLVTSRLRRTAEGRYETHDLLRQYSKEKLMTHPAENESLRDQHCRYYAEFMVRHKPQLKGDDPHAALATLSAERENVRAAWNWAVEHRKAAELDMFMERL